MIFLSKRRYKFMISDKNAKLCVTISKKMFSDIETISQEIGMSKTLITVSALQKYIRNYKNTYGKKGEN